MLASVSRVTLMSIDCSTIDRRRAKGGAQGHCKADKNGEQSLTVIISPLPIDPAPFWRKTDISIELEETNPSWVRSARVRREFSLSAERVQYVSPQCATGGNVHSHERVSVHCAERVSPVDRTREMVDRDGLTLCRDDVDPGIYQVVWHCDGLEGAISGRRRG